MDFQTSNIADVEKEFHCAVDDYLIFCSEVGKEPEKEYKGTFNVRIKPELHKKLAFKALEDGDSLNKAVENAIAVYLSDGRANDINKDIKEIREKLSGENVVKNYGKYILKGQN